MTKLQGAGFFLEILVIETFFWLETTHVKKKADHQLSIKDVPHGTISICMFPMLVQH